MPIYKQDGKKDGLQKYRVMVSFTDKDGKYKKLTGTAYGKEEARQLEMELASKTKEAPSNRMTIDGLIKEYLNSNKSDVRQVTLNRKESHYRLHVSPFIGSTRLSKLTSSVLQTWKNNLNETSLCTSSKNSVYDSLSALMNYAVRMEYISSNPLHNVGRFHNPDFTKEMEAERVRYYTADQFLQFIAVAKADAESKDDWRYYVFFNIAFYTGMRKGEIYALKWSDIDRNILHVRRSINQKLKGGDVENPPKKKSSYRDIQIPAPLIKILNDHLSRCQSLPSFSKDWRVCGDVRSIRDTAVFRKNNRYAAAAKLDHITIHEFRHSHASVLINEGISIQEIARRLGHSDVQITWKTYAHLYPREEERAVKILDRVFLAE